MAAVAAGVVAVVATAAVARCVYQRWCAGEETIHINLDSLEDEEISFREVLEKGISHDEIFDFNDETLDLDDGSKHKLRLLTEAVRHGLDTDEDDDEEEDSGGETKESASTRSKKQKKKDNNDKDDEDDEDDDEDALELTIPDLTIAASTTPVKKEDA